jgi:hypothetical protein
LPAEPSPQQVESPDAETGPPRVVAARSGFAAIFASGAAEADAAPQRKPMANEVMARIRRLGTVATRLENRIVFR